MYNRYIPSGTSYTRIPEEEPRPGRETHSTAEQPRPDPPPAHESAASPPHASGTSHRGESGMIQHLLDQLHLDRVDTGDLLLLHPAENFGRPLYPRAICFQAVEPPEETGRAGT